MSLKFSLLPAREHSCQDAANRRRDAGGQLTHTKERPVRTADKIQKSPASCADRCSLNNCILASAGMAFIWLQRGHHLLLFPLPLSILWGWFPKAGGRGPSLSPKRGFQRGKRRSAAGGGVSEPLSRKHPGWQTQSGWEPVGATVFKPQFRPFVPRGGMGDGGVPHVSGGGLRGRDLCAKDSFPLPCSGNYLLREQRGIISITRCNGNL